MTRFSLKRTIAVLLTVAVVAGCGSSKPSATQPPKTETPAAPPSETTAAAQTLKIGIGAFVRSLDPHMDTSASAFPVFRAMFDTLVKVDKSGKLIPGLAETWKSVDAKTWEFKLRKGVKFHNGEPFNAETVKANFAKILKPENKVPWAGRVNKVSDVKVVDESTVQFVTTSPFSSLPANLTVIFMVPPKYIADKGYQAFLDAPVGTGPLQFVEWKKDSFLKLKANPDYFGGKPALESVTFNYLPEASGRMASLQSNEQDLILDVPADQADILKSKGYTVNAVPLGANLVFNLRTFSDTPIKDKRVRQAINLAVDKEAIVKSLYSGYAKVLDGQIVGSDANGYNPALKPFPYDPKKAKELLAEAGYKDGFTITLQGTQGRYPKDKELTEAVQQYLGEVGVKAKIETLESSVWLAKLYDGTLGPIGIMSWQYMPPMDAELPLVYNISSSALTFLKNSDFDKLMARQAETFDAAERTKVLQQAVAKFTEEIPMIFLIQPQLVYAYKTDVKGVELQPDWSFVGGLIKASRGK